MHANTEPPIPPRPPARARPIESQDIFEAGELLSALVGDHSTNTVAEGERAVRRALFVACCTQRKTGTYVSSSCVGGGKATIAVFQGLVKIVGLEVEFPGPACLFNCRRGGNFGCALYGNQDGCTVGN